MKRFLEGKTQGPSVALISMPWMIASMPSIQLAILHDLLCARDIRATRYELFLDFAKEIGFPAYERISSGSSLAPEWIFARGFYGPERSSSLDEFLIKRATDPVGGNSIPNSVLEYAAVVAEEFIESWADKIVADGHTIFAFSLTISQTASSLAMARALKSRSPHAFIVFGGSSCAGSMGAALLKMSKDIDITVSGEAELTIDSILKIAAGESASSWSEGLNWREDERIISGKSGKLHQLSRPRIPLNYDSYFERKAALGLGGDMEMWIPVESSRGCWYGEKSQCTFCGLHEIMSFRERPIDSFVQELVSLYQRHGADKFFTVDLIMPQSYQRTLPGKLGSLAHQFQIFYEIKANIRREILAELRRAGVTWIQPGIESLDESLLRLMKKGVPAAQNVALLRNCRELEIRVTWSLLTGVPGECEEAYTRMLKLIPLISHLPPPSGCTSIELHRFSPYFERPHEYGITNVRPHRLYNNVFPESDAILSDLVYLHEFDCGTRQIGSDVHRALNEAVHHWQHCYQNGAALAFDSQTSEVIDSRAGSFRKTPLTRLQLDVLKEFSAPVPLPECESRILAALSPAYKGLKGSDICRELFVLREWGFCTEIGSRIISLVCFNEEEGNGTFGGTADSEKLHGRNEEGRENLQRA